MKLRDVMTQRVRSISPDSTLKEAAEQMRSLDAGSLPVCEAGKLLGIITDRDITVRSTAGDLRPSEAQVRDAMTNDLVYCFEDEDVDRAAELMERRQIRRLPILDRNMQLVGIVSLGDLATRQHNHQLSGEVLEQVSQPGQPHL